MPLTAICEFCLHEIPSTEMKTEIQVGERFHHLGFHCPAPECRAKAANLKRIQDET